MEKSDFVIIGGVAAGPKTAASLARRLPEAKITVFQKEEHISYGTCGLPYFASGDINSFEELTITSYGVVRSPNFFNNSKGFDIRPGSVVVKINRDTKVVTVKDLKSNESYDYGYGKLVLATGANPVKPPFPIVNSPKIQPFTRPDDAINFRKMAQQGQIESAFIIGGGFIGCELAEAAGSLWGIDVTLIEKENQLLPYLLDPEMAKIVQHELARNDVKLLIGATVEKIDVCDDKPVVVTDGKENIPTDYVFLCFGVRPETTLARQCGLEIGTTGGIKVNKLMQTSDPDIFAGGDCVESYNRITNKPVYLPMGSLANRHGRVIGENLAGNKTEFSGVLGSSFIKVFDLNAGSVGLTESEALNNGLSVRSAWGSFPDKPDYYPESKTFSLKMVYNPDDSRLLGLQATGQGDICRRIDVFSSFLQKQATIDDLLQFEHGYAPPYAEALDPLHHLAAIAQAQAKGTCFISPGADFIKLDNNVTWLDVREPDEVSNEKWGCSEKDNYINIPLDDLKKQLNELDPGKKIILVCRRGPRSYQASVILKQAGFKDVSIIAGGTTAVTN